MLSGDSSCLNKLSDIVSVLVALVSYPTRPKPVGVFQLNNSQTSGMIGVL